MDKKVLVIILVISVAINLATMFSFGYFWWTSHTQENNFPAPPRMMPDWQHARMSKELGLSDQQIEQIKEANEAMRSAMQPLREELFEKRQELMSLLREDEMDRARADQLIEQIAELQAEHDAQIFDRLLVLKEILTPEQRQRLGALMHDMLESGRPPGMPEAPIHHHHHFEMPRGEGGR